VVVKYRFKRVETAEDILEAIGRKDIPSTKVVIRRPSVDEATGEYLADLEIEFPNEYYLTDADEAKLKSLMASMGFKFKEKKNYIVFGGRPTVEKGIVEAFLAFKKIANVFNGYKLYVTGKISNNIANRLFRFAKRLGIGDKVVFTGFVSREERFGIVREAKLMLYPSHVDAFPYAVAESLLLGTPVVAYDIPAIDIYYKGLEGIRIVRELDMDAMASEAIDILSRDRVDVEAPRLRPWRDIIEEEISLIKRVVERF